jgi:hypothetical protein
VGWLRGARKMSGIILWLPVIVTAGLGSVLAVNSVNVKVVVEVVIVTLIVTYALLLLLCVTAFDIMAYCSVLLLAMLLLKFNVSDRVYVFVATGSLADVVFCCAHVILTSALCTSL